MRRLKSPKLKRLTVLVPEKHDLVLMKLVRGSEADIQAAVDIFAACGLRRATLEKRFAEEMRHVIGNPRRLALNLEACIARVFLPRPKER